MGRRADGTHSTGSPQKTVRFADEDLLHWAETKAAKDGTDFTTVVITALYRLRESEKVTA